MSSSDSLACRKYSNWSEDAFDVSMKKMKDFVAGYTHKKTFNALICQSIQVCGHK